MTPYYKIMDYSDKGPKTLFHANDGSKTIPTKQWVKSSKHKLVSDGSSNTKYISGWHVMSSLDEAKDYLYNNFKNMIGKIIVKCFVMDDIREKSHSRSNVYLANMIYLDEIVFTHTD